MKIVLLLGMIAALPALAWQDGTGTIEVRALLGEQAPDLPVVVVDKNIPFCGEKIKDPILLTHEGAVINSVAFVDWSGETAPLEEKQNLALKTSGCLIEPRVQTARTGAFLHLNSGDTITHNPHAWLDDKRTVFNLTLVDQSFSFKRKLRWPGRYRIDCDTHSWMKAYVLIFDHPYHAVSSQDGKAVIANVPAGKHRVTVWHEVLGKQTTELTVTPGKTSVWSPTFALIDHRQDKIKPKTQEPWPAKGR